MAQPISLYISAFIILSIIIAIVLFLSFSHYARKETIRGYLVPEKDLIKTFANRSGNVEILHVSEAGQDHEYFLSNVSVIFKPALHSG